MHSHERLLVLKSGNLRWLVLQTVIDGSRGSELVDKNMDVCFT